MRKVTLLLFLAVATLLRAAPEYPSMGPDIYDPQADGTQQITDAIRVAHSDHRHVLIVFGANWCIWCRRLHTLFDTNEAVRKVLKRDFHVVYVDVNHRDGKKRNAEANKRYGDPMKKGLPVLVVLDWDGHQITTQETGIFENGKNAHDPEKVIAFLKDWAPDR